MTLRILAIILLFLGFTSNSFSLSIENRLENDALENRSKSIFKQIRCVTCDGESIYDSRSDIAKSMRELIRNDIKNGKSDYEIIDSFVKSYGDVILMQPPFKLSTSLLWFSPLILLAISLIYILIFFQSRTAKK